MSDRFFSWQHRVTYAECTLGNHVFHARFLDILDRARGEFFRQLGQELLQLQEGGTILPVVECRLQYKAMARYDDLLHIEIRVAGLERIRLRLHYRILHADGRLLVEAEVDYACTNVEGRLQRLPQGLRAALQPFLEVA